jgi:hypothetical protein
MYTLVLNFYHPDIVARISEQVRTAATQGRRTTTLGRAPCGPPDVLC